MPIVSPIVSSVVSSVVSGSNPAPPGPSCREIASLNGTTQVIQLSREGSLFYKQGEDAFLDSFYFEGVWDLDSTGTLVSQNISGPTDNREFQFYQQSGSLTAVLGGQATRVASGLSGSPKLGVERDRATGDIMTYVDGELHATKSSVIVGAAREALATLVLSARHDSDLTSYGFRKPGIVKNFKLWTGGNKTTGNLVRNVPVDDGFSSNPTIQDLTGASKNGEAIGFTAGTWSEVCE